MKQHTQLVFKCFALLLVTITQVGCNDQLKADHQRLLQENEELRENLTNTQAALDGATADRDKLNQDLASAKAAQPEPAPAPEKANTDTGFANIGDGVTVIPGAGQITLRIPGDVLFASGKTSLKASAQRTLQRISQVIASKYAGNLIRVEGHSDTDPIRKSKWKDNLELSGARAMAVHRYMLRFGVKSKNLYSAAFASARPRSSKAASRRVEIVVIQ